jgi:hypothetical protein
MGGQAAVHFPSLRLRERGLLDLSSNAIPDLLDESKPLDDAQPVNPKSLKGWRHSATSEGRER